MMTDLDVVLLRSTLSFVSTLAGYAYHLLGWERRLWLGVGGNLKHASFDFLYPLFCISSPFSRHEPLISSLGLSLTSILLQL